MPGTGTNQTVSSIFAMPSSSFAVFAPGGLKVWGTNEGDLVPGYDHGLDLIPTPTAVPRPGGTTTWPTIVGGQTYTFGLTADGELWAWGSNGHFGVFGDVSMPTSAPPARVGSDHWKSVAAGDNTAVGVRTDGTLWQWGDRVEETNGVGGPPQQIGTATSWASVDAEGGFFAGLTTSKELWLWSTAVEGTSNSWVPTKVTAPATWKSVSISWPNWVGIAANGSLWVGQGYRQTAPVLLSTETGWTDIAATPWNLYAIRP